jgi:hypothetical protein
MAEEDEAVEIITPKMEQALQDLCARRSTMAEDDFADALCDVLEIPRELLDKAVMIESAGMRADVEAGLIDFDEAYRIARARN